MKRSFVLAFLAASTVACAAAPDDKPAAAAAPAPARAACAEAPTELRKKDIKPGDGPEVRFRTAVTVNYTGWLFDPCAPEFKGKQFDSSVGRATPFGLVVGAGRVIKGWDEGLVGMKEGGKRTLIIPPDKGYGARGAGSTIPPNATLVFDVEIMKVLAQGDGGK